MKYQNPILPGFHPDPSVIRVNEDFYLVNSSFEYFPGVPIWHSRDLIHWSLIGHCLTRPSQFPLDTPRSSGGIYAPTIRWHGGVYYMVTTNVSHRPGNFIVTAADPGGEWSEPVWVRGLNADSHGIDPSLFFDDDGRVYFTSTGLGGIAQAEIDVRSGRLLSASRLIWTGTGGRFPEGPHIYKSAGLYYLMIAEGGTEYGHMVTMARSRSPWGPYEPCPANPILTHRDRGGHPIQCTGHAELVDDAAGNWWLVCLGTRPQGYPPAHHLGRETFLAPVVWKEREWPRVAEGRGLELEMEGEPPKLFQWPEAPERDDFDVPRLAPCWNFRFVPDPDSWSLTARPGWLRLMGQATTLQDGARSPTWVGRRQEHFSCRVEALIDFRPSDDREEAGLTVYMNENHHYEVGLQRESSGRSIFVRRRIGDLEAVVAMDAAPDGPIRLHIEADPRTYRFAWVDSNGALHPLVTAQTRYLSTEVAGGFTGVYFALYATGNGRPCRAPADFDWFEYEAR